MNQTLLTNIARSVFETIKGWKLSLFWVCLVVICTLAVISGYCVSLSISGGFDFSVCESNI